MEEMACSLNRLATFSSSTDWLIKECSFLPETFQTSSFIFFFSCFFLFFYFDRIVSHILLS